MIETLEQDTEKVGRVAHDHSDHSDLSDLSAADLLTSIKSSRQVEQAEAARQLSLAARWADLHPPESIHHAATFTVPGCEHEEPLAGQGCPLVAEFCIAELGTVLGISTTGAKKLIGHALELRHRLPRLWTHVHAGRVPAWRARLVAEATIHATPALTIQAAAHVDAQVAAAAGRIGPAQLDRLVAETITKFQLAAPDPTTDPVDGWLHVDPRHATLHDDHVHFAGTMRFEAELDIADALDLNHALAHGAATMKALGSEESLDVRRAAALGDLARTQTTLDLLTAAPDEDLGGRVAREERAGVSRPTSQRVPAAREVVFHVHLDAELHSESTGGHTVFGPTARLEQHHKLVLLDQVRSWCNDTGTKVSIKPVIDLNIERRASGYTIPDRLRQHVILRDKTCVFPFCTRPARGCDVDHVVAYDHDADTDGRPQPGPTRTCNLAALCRLHHRLKTHTRWRYTVEGPGAYIWTSPHGHRYRRDHTGTTALPAISDPPGLVTGARAPSSTTGSAARSATNDSRAPSATNEPDPPERP